MESLIDQSCAFINSREALVEEKRRELQREEVKFIERREELQRQILDTAYEVLTEEFLFLREYLVFERYDCFVSKKLYLNVPIDKYPNVFDYYEEVFTNTSSESTRRVVQEILKYKPYYRTVVKNVTLGVIVFYENDRKVANVISIESIEYDGKLHKRKQRREIFFPQREVELSLLTRVQRTYHDSKYSQCRALYETKGLWLERV